MKLLLYCTKAKPYLNCDCGKDNHEEYSKEHFIYLANKQEECSNIANGKIVAECDFEVEELLNCGNAFRINKYDDQLENYRYTNEVARESCLNFTDLKKYLGDNNGYAIHIKNLHIFDKPRDITKLVLLNQYRKDLKGSQYNRVKNAPQNMCLVDYAIDCNYKEKIFDSPYVLISIQPQWLCKILNGEKTIEVRKKVLKEMLK